MAMISNITVCKLPYQKHWFVHGECNGKDVWLLKDGTWTEIDGHKDACLKASKYLCKLEDKTNYTVRPWQIGE